MSIPTGPTPYYQDEHVTLYHGDCLDVLAEIGGESVDVVLTDPPFFMPAAHYSSRTQWQRSWGDTSILAAFWGQCLDGIIPAMRTSGHLLALLVDEQYCEIIARRMDQYALDFGGA